MQQQQQQRGDTWLDFGIKACIVIALMQLGAGLLGSGHGYVLLAAGIAGFMWKRIRELETRVGELERRAAPVYAPAG